MINNYNNLYDNLDNSTDDDENSNIEINNQEIKNNENIINIKNKEFKLEDFQNILNEGEEDDEEDDEDEEKKYIEPKILENICLKSPLPVGPKSLRI
jgi:hypothetical protein